MVFFQKAWSSGRAGLLSVAVLLAGAAGCTWTDGRGTHQLIVGVGFGIITTTNRPGVDVSDTRLLGAMAGPGGASAGWMLHHQVEINPVIASNVVISIQTGHGGITVKNFNPYTVNTNLPAQTKPENQ